MDIKDIKKIADIFKSTTGRRAYFNYICNGNEKLSDAVAISNIVEGHHLTCSVLCSTKELKKSTQEYAESFLKLMDGCEKDIELSMFNPEGQDTIGGGCGQLLYVQEKLNQ